MSDPYEFPDLSDGSCVGIDTELFFPEHGLNQFSDQMKTIRKMCAECPVVNACLTYALHVEVEGVWAGTGVVARQKLRRDLGIKAIKLHTQYTTEAMMAQTQDAIAARKRRANNKEQVA
jgi:WhiB family redox-sensing transcriptional regulator